MIQLRPYQEAAKSAVYHHLRTRDDNPCVVLPTGGGKTPLLASICRDAVEQWQGRVLVLAHVKELLQQAEEKLRTMCPGPDVGVYSAGLKRREKHNAVVLASIQSVYKRACELDAFDLIVVDEAHLIPQQGEGMYRRFLADTKVVNPAVRILGLTATPFRVSTGPICTPDGILNHVCFEIGIRELIRDGFLCPLLTKASKTQFDTSDLSVRDGEFVAGEVEELMDQDALVHAACEEIEEYTKDRRSCLVFASGIEHGRHVQQVLGGGFVCGETAADEREQLLHEFRQGEMKYLTNVNVLTTGFDATGVDCVVMLRPTLSPGLYYQMVGRGFRIHPDKSNCLVLDFGGNILRHGPVDMLSVSKPRTGTGKAVVKVCPQCQSVISAGFARCPDCGYRFPPMEKENHASSATTAGVLSNQLQRYDVKDVFYFEHTKRGADEDHPKTMRVDYQVGFNNYISEWVCFEHSGYARQQAVNWWRKRSLDPVPDSTYLAVEIANTGGLAMTHAILVQPATEETYEQVLGHEVGVPPETYFSDPGTSNEEVPF